MNTDINTRAMLAKLSISVWTARKYDKAATEEVTRSHGASMDAGRFNKHLLGGKAAAASHNAVVSASSSARVVHYAQTLPWSDDGWRILPTDNWMHYTGEIRKVTNTFSNAVYDFTAQYPDLRTQAKALLNGLYRDEDYPDPATIGKRFAIGVEYAPIPARGDVRINLPQAQIDDIEKRIEERVNNAVADAMRDAWGRLHGVVERVRERLSDPDAIFRDSLISNVRECVDVLARLNLTNDPKLEEMRLRVQSELGTLDPESLREHHYVRDHAAQSAQDIINAMAGMYGAPAA